MFEKAVAKNPGFLTARNNLAAILMEKNDYTGAILNYSEVLASGPADFALLFNLGLAYARIGEFYRAESLWKQAYTLNPQDSDIQDALQYVRTKLDAANKARR